MRRTQRSRANLHLRSLAALHTQRLWNNGCSTAVSQRRKPRINLTSDGCGMMQIAIGVEALRQSKLACQARWLSCWPPSTESCDASKKSHRKCSKSAEDAWLAPDAPRDTRGRPSLTSFRHWSCNSVDSINWRATSCMSFVSDIAACCPKLGTRFMGAPMSSPKGIELGKASREGISSMAWTRESALLTTGGAGGGSEGPEENGSPIGPSISASSSVVEWSSNRLLLLRPVSINDFRKGSSMLDWLAL
mmetsp:Transcript_20768/g.46476  ORF Transcript_20768/g.46476 Transcript_20768/m.46476 type:complete len:248 (+) Transcript_20768:1529-2272(+)